MLRRCLNLTSLMCVCCFLTACGTTSESKPRPGVAEAKACQKSLQSNPAAIPGFIIRACTNTGVWLVDQIDPVVGNVAAQYDFVNGDYAGPQTGYSPVPVESLGEDVIQSYRAVRTSLNRGLKDTL